MVPDSRVAAAAQRQGVGLVGDADFARLGRTLDVRAFVSAYTQKRDRRGAGRCGSSCGGATPARAVGRLLVTGRRLDRLERTLTRQTSPRLQALVEEAVVDQGRAREPKARCAPPPTSSEAVVEDSEQRPGELIELTLDGRVFSRSFTYAQNLSRLPEYRLGRALASALEVTLAARRADLRARWRAIGLTGGLEYGLGVRSVARGPDSRVTNDVRGYSLGLEYRLALGASSVAPQLGYTSSSFITGDEAGAAPNVRYRTLTGGAAGRWAISPRLRAAGTGSLPARAVGRPAQRAGSLLAGHRARPAG